MTPCEPNRAPCGGGRAPVPPNRVRAELRPVDPMFGVADVDARPWAAVEAPTVADALRQLAAESELRQGAILHTECAVILAPVRP